MKSQQDSIKEQALEKVSNKITSVLQKAGLIQNINYKIEKDQATPASFFIIFIDKISLGVDLKRGRALKLQKFFKDNFADDCHCSFNYTSKVNLFKIHLPGLYKKALHDLQSAA